MEEDRHALYPRAWTLKSSSFADGEPAIDASAACLIDRKHPQYPGYFRQILRFSSSFRLYSPISHSWNA